MRISKDHSQSVGSEDGRDPGRQTDRLEREKAVNRCRAMAGITPRPFRPAPPSIVGMESERGRGEDRRENSGVAEVLHFWRFFAREFSAGRRAASEVYRRSLCYTITLLPRYLENAPSYVLIDSFRYPVGTCITSGLLLHSPSYPQSRL